MQRTGEINKSVDTLWRRDGRLKVMKNIDEMLNEIGENKEIKEGGNMRIFLPFFLYFEEMP